MRTVLGIVLALTTPFAAAVPDVVRTFEEDRPGAPPSGFAFAGTNQGTPVPWLVTRLGDNRVLSYLGPGTAKGASLAVLDTPPLQDLSISVRLKLVAGDQQGGLVWRYQDENNHYLARLDLKEQKIGLYRVVRGNRIRIDSEDDLELDPSAWHVLKAVQDRDRIRLYLGGIKVFDIRDRIFAGPGGVGLWSSAGSAGHFDDFRVDDRIGRKP